MGHHTAPHATSATSITSGHAVLLHAVTRNKIFERHLEYRPGKILPCQYETSNCTSAIKRKIISLEPNLHDSGLEALEKYPHIEHANAGTNHSTTKCSHN
jgi:hypothetical protein